MWRLTWQLASTGIPFSFQPETTEAELYARIKKLTVWQGLRETTGKPRVAFRLDEQSLVLYVVKVSFWMLARPVFYADIETSGQTITIKGRFYFQKLIRVEFWLIVIGAIIYESIWLLRAVNRILAELPFEQLIGFLVMLLPGILVLVIAFSILSVFTKKNATDLQIMTDALQEVAT